MANLVDLKVKDFIKEVDSDSPAPGGGSVSSAVSTIGCALARMVGHLSFGKKKYEANSDADKKQFEEMFNKIKTHQDRLEVLVDEDTKSFGVFMDAMKLPKETEEEKAYRKEQMEEATKVIIKVPYEIAVESMEALRSLQTILDFGNMNAVTDVGVAALLLTAGVEGAVLNVKINLPGLSDQALVSEYVSNCDAMIAEASNLKTKYIEIVNNSL